MTVITYKSSISGKAVETPQAPNKSALSDIVEAGKTQKQDSYVNQLTKLGYAKMGKPVPSDESSSADPVADMISALDKMDSSTLGAMPFKKISAESILSQFPDMPEAALEKYQAIVAMLQSKLDETKQALTSGQGTAQQLQWAQQFKSQLEELLSFYKNQTAKLEKYIPIKNNEWKKEFAQFSLMGGSSKPETFDLDGDGWIGKPNASDSYRIGIYTHDKNRTDPEAKKLGLKCDFKKGETQSWAINPKTNQRVMFDPISKKVVNEQIPAPDYIADLGSGFSSLEEQKDGKMTLTINNASKGKFFAETGLELHTPEYIYVETDADGEVITPPQVAPFELSENGSLVQNKPEGNYKQVYVKEMRVSSVRGSGGKPGGDIIVEFRGGLGGATSKLLSLHIKASGDLKQATDVALAITSGEGKSHRETPVVIDAKSYESTSRDGISQFDYFDKLTEKDPAHKTQINDTLKNFKASANSKIDSALNRGISFRTKGHIAGTNSNDLYIVEEPADHLSNKDAAYTTIIEGGKGNNALFAQGKGSLYANGITLISKDSGDAEDDIRVGINPYGYQKDKKTGVVSSTEGKSSNKIYMHINAMNSTVQVENAPDSRNETAGKTPQPWESDDVYDVHGKVVHVVEPEMDTDVSDIQGLDTQNAAGSGDFKSSDPLFNEKIKGLKESLGKPASAELDTFQVEGQNFAWQQGKHYKEDKSMLDGFFLEFTGANLNKADPFKQLEDLDEKVT